MGNSCRIAKLITDINRLPTLISKEEEENLQQLFKYYSDRELEKIPFQNFSIMIGKDTNSKFSKKLFNIFTYNSMSYYQFSLFYLVFKKSECKAELFSELLFGKNYKINDTKYTKRLSFFFDGLKIKEKFLDLEKCLKKIKDKSGLYDKNKFLGIFKEELSHRNNPDKVLFELCRTVDGSSEVDFTVNRNKDQYFNYYCDCYKKKSKKAEIKENKNQENQENKENKDKIELPKPKKEELGIINSEVLYSNLDEKLESSYDRFLNQTFRRLRNPDNINNNNNILTFKEFSTFLLNGKINKLYIKRIINYILKSTQKDFVTFEIFRDFCIWFNCYKNNNYFEGQLKLLFKILFYPSSSLEDIKIEEINEILNLQNQIKIFDLKEINTVDKLINLIMNDPSLIQSKKYIKDQIDIIGLQPYIYNDNTPEDHITKKLIIKNIIYNHSKNSYNFDELLMNSFSYTNKYYIINTEFIKNLINNVNDNLFYNKDFIESQEIIDNKKLCKFFNILEPKYKYGSDFYIIPDFIYKKFKQFYSTNKESEVEIEKKTWIKIDKNKENNKELKINFNTESGFIYSTDSDNNKIEEIDFYPVNTLVFDFNLIVKLAKKRKKTDQNLDEEINLININYNDILNECEIQLTTKGDFIVNKFSNNLVKINRNEPHVSIKEMIKKRLPDKNREFKFYYFIKETESSQENESSQTTQVGSVASNNSNEQNQVKVQKEQVKDDNKEIVMVKDQPKSTIKAKFRIVQPDQNKTLLEANYTYILIILVDQISSNGEYDLDIITTKSQTSASTSKPPAKEPAAQKEEIEQISQKDLLKLKEKEKEEKEKEKERLQLEKEEDARILIPPFGLPNIGNSCYFNSVLQQLINLPIIKSVFLDPKFKYFINKKNQFGHKGKLISKFISLYSQNRVILNKTLVDLKEFIGKVNENFNNYNQQDANEFLIFMLENLHEEINIYSKKLYISLPEYHSITDYELSNIYWANEMRRSFSFVNSIFMFQLKSILTCLKCNNTKISFESNYIMDLPISLGKLVQIDVYLHRLPFFLKAYYDNISSEFKEFNCKFNDRGMIKNLEVFMEQELDLNQDVNEEKKEEVIINNDEGNSNDKGNGNENTNEKMDYSYKKKCTCYNRVLIRIFMERNNKLKDIVSYIKKIKSLELEYIITDTSSEDDEINDLSYFLITNSSNTILDSESVIENYVSGSDTISFNLIELLNSKGLYKLFNGTNSDKAKFVYPYKIIQHQKENDLEKNADTADKDLKNRILLSVNPLNLIKHRDKYKEKEQLSGNQNQSQPKQESFIYKWFPFARQKTKNQQTQVKAKQTPAQRIPEEPSKTISFIKKEYKKEYMVPIVHFKTKDNENILFDGLSHSSELSMQYLISNNTELYLNIKDLYNYIWNLNKVYLTYPKKDDDFDLWWENKDTKAKKCYPFVLRKILFETYNRYSIIKTKCSTCPWYSFCPGCIINPHDSERKYVTFSENDMICVDWCYKIKFNYNLFNISYTLDYEKLQEEESLLKSTEQNLTNKQNGSKNIEDEKTIFDCFNLFLEKEFLEDKLYCNKCMTHQLFCKNYEISRLPYVLIISLKRFKYTEFSRSKLIHFIKYPLYNLELQNRKYNLFGVINHYGNIGYGHYTSFVNINNQWKCCNDGNVYNVKEGNVINSNAYILIYVSTDDILKDKYFSYYQMVNLIRENIKVDEKGNLNGYNNDVFGNRFFMGEPVNTPYGKGYVMKDYDFNGKEAKDNKDLGKETEIIDVKFDFGMGSVNRKNIQKEICFNIKNSS